MNALPWMIPSWPQVKLPAKMVADGLPSFWHANSDVVVTKTATVATQGQTVWMAEVCGQIVGFAWDWAEIMPGVPVLSDPNAILSNVLFVDDEGKELGEASQIRAANQLVYGLPWQAPVRAALRLLDEAERGAMCWPPQRAAVAGKGLVTDAAQLAVANLKQAGTAR